MLETVGDIVMCKKSFEYIESKVFMFNQGIYYLITDMYNYSKVGDNSAYVQLYVESDRDYCNLPKEIYEKHFFTKRELRKLKLEKINEIEKG